jgi:hypothetical protein
LSVASEIKTIFEPPKEETLKPAILAVTFACLISYGASAQTMKVLPLAPPNALLTGSAADRQAATIEKFGQVSIQEIALARKIDSSDSSIASVKQHSNYFDFYLVPLKFGVIGFDGKSCKSMQFGATLKAAGADSAQAFVLNVFPATSLKPGSLSADGKLVLSSDLKLATPDEVPVKGSVGISGNANIAWKWSPLYQQVAAVYDQSRIIWKFDAVGSEFPVGETDVAVIVALAKSVSKKSTTKLGFDVEMSANFGGSWFDQNGVARVNTTVLVRLP